MSLQEPIAGMPATDKQDASVLSLDESTREFLSQSGLARFTRRGQSGRLAAALVLTDLFAIALGFGLAMLLADVLRPLLNADQVAAWPFLLQRSDELIPLMFLTIGIFAFGGLYRRSAWELDEIRRVVAGVGLVAMFDATLQFALNDHNSRLWAVMAYPLVGVLVVSLRMAVRSLSRVREAMTNHIILLGSGTTPETLEQELRESRAAPVELLHSLALDQVREREPHHLVRMLERLARQKGVPEHRVQTVLAPAPDEIKDTQTVLAMLNAANRPYSVVLPFTGLARSGLGLQKVIGADMVMAEMRPATPRGLTSFFKRIFDLVLTILIVLAAAPFLIGIIALLVLERGPVFFSQMRVGRDGKQFRCFKFRSMRPDAQERLLELLDTDPEARRQWETRQKLDNDPRITPLGQFLRKTSLDELPQLLNVLKGDMSLVGPRPIIAPEIEGYPGDRAYFSNPEFIYYKRCTPGITGLWQVSGRSSTSHDERVRLDRWYARNWSFWLDLMILFKTVRAVLRRDGSS